MDVVGGRGYFAKVKSFKFVISEFIIPCNLKAHSLADVTYQILLSVIQYFRSYSNYNCKYINLEGKV